MPEFEPLPAIEPPVRGASPFRRRLPCGAAVGWLMAGMTDFGRRMPLSLAYGVVVFVLSAVVIAGLWHAGFHYLILPALSGFLVVGPIVAAGLYEKSRRLAAGEPVTLADMIFVRPRSGGQLAFAGLLLCLLVVLWLRAADLLYALFFGLLPFPGFDDVLRTVLTTPEGWALMAVGTAVGGLFAAFAMAISLFSIPMLLEEDTDALTALGTSFALTWRNLGTVLPWGIIVVAGFALCVVTALAGLIVVFPVLGHGTWHAWRAMRQG